jgi:hypothetical protein
MGKWGGMSFLVRAGSKRGVLCPLSVKGDSVPHPPITALQSLAPITRKLAVALSNLTVVTHILQLG